MGLSATTPTHTHTCYIEPLYQNALKEMAANRLTTRPNCIVDTTQGNVLVPTSRRIYNYSIGDATTDTSVSSVDMTSLLHHNDCVTGAGRRDAFNVFTGSVVTTYNSECSNRNTIVRDLGDMIVANAVDVPSNTNVMLHACDAIKTATAVDERMQRPAVCRTLDDARLTYTGAMSAGVGRSVALVTPARPGGIGGLKVFDPKLDTVQFVPLPCWELATRKLAMHPDGRFVALYNLVEVDVVDVQRPGSASIRCAPTDARRRPRATIRHVAMFSKHVPKGVPTPGVFAVWSDGSSSIWYMCNATEEGVVQESTEDALSPSDGPVIATCADRIDPFRVIAGIVERGGVTIDAVEF